MPRIYTKYYIYIYKMTSCKIYLSINAKYFSNMELLMTILICNKSVCVNKPIFLLK